ncbi:hypothetical protein [Aliamphritea hakodatensis]|nr:hypothetical protein [Aliamphritea hakodatensis]
MDDYLASGLLVKPVSTSVETTSRFLMLEPEQTAPSRAQSISESGCYR